MHCRGDEIPAQVMTAFQRLMLYWGVTCVTRGRPGVGWTKSFVTRGRHTSGTMGRELLPDVWGWGGPIRSWCTFSALGIKSLLSILSLNYQFESLLMEILCSLEHFLSFSFFLFSADNWCGQLADGARRAIRANVGDKQCVPATFNLLIPQLSTSTILEAQYVR